ncbi:MAG: heme ABC exporter ATP-binding protein CcmA [Hyphomicrobiaceae bacterium]|nr:heme ABC exporter ATP-binding protein CcmA [Hyphomicrobiaceae bacterium]
MRLGVQDLTCVRGGRTVFENLSFEVKKGSGLQLTGANGVGKSSLLRILAGFLPPAAGRITLEGADDETPIGEFCHYVGHLNGVKRAFTVRENLLFWSEYCGGGDIDPALETFNLLDLSDIPAGLLSAGQARRLGLARLQVIERPLWLLDEPSVSLDEASRNILASAIRNHTRNGGLAIAATHLPLGVKFAHTLELGAEAH